MIVTKIVTDEGVTKVSGSVFGENHYRLVEIKGFKVDVIPDGVMLLIQNKDVPGVIGSVGTFLGKQNINIAAYILSRKSDSGNAFAVVRVDNQLSTDQIKILCELKFIDKCKQIILND